MPNIENCENCKKRMHLKELDPEERSKVISLIQQILKSDLTDAQADLACGLIFANNKLRSFEELILLARDINP